MPRRYVDYPDAFAYWNWWSSVGSYITAAGTLVFIVGMLYAYFVARVKAADNPWGAGATTLEWTLPSPPAFHSYETLPAVQGDRAPLTADAAAPSHERRRCSRHALTLRGIRWPSVRARCAPPRASAAASATSSP